MGVESNPSKSRKKQKKKKIWSNEEYNELNEKAEWIKREEERTKETEHQEW